MGKWSLAELATHLELMAKGQDIIVRFLSESGATLDDKESSREKTLQAARALKELAPFQEKLRAFLIEQKNQQKDW